jgi:hypothetical protein
MQGRQLGDIPPLDKNAVAEFSSTRRRLGRAPGAPFVDIHASKNRSRARAPATRNLPQLYSIFDENTRRTHLSEHVSSCGASIRHRESSTGPAQPTRGRSGMRALVRHFLLAQRSNQASALPWIASSHASLAAEGSARDDGEAAFANCDAAIRNPRHLPPAAALPGRPSPSTHRQVQIAKRELPSANCPARIAKRALPSR